MAGVLLSPSAHVKSKTLEAANKIRHGSPKLHEVLRQVSFIIYCYFRALERFVFVKHWKIFMKTVYNTKEILTLIFYMNLIISFFI